MQSIRGPSWGADSLLPLPCTYNRGELSLKIRLRSPLEEIMKMGFEGVQMGLDLAWARFLTWEFSAPRGWGLESGVGFWVVVSLVGGGRTK